MKSWEIIMTAMVRMHIPSISELARRTGIQPATLQKNVREPGTMSVGRLRTLAEYTNMTDTEIAAVVKSAPRR
jgi:hypothetical protein